MKKKRKFGKGAMIILIIVFVLFVYLISLSFKGDGTKGGDKIALIPIKGFISVDSGSSGNLFQSGGASSSVIVNFIKKANEDNKIKGIILEINSPGGNIVASREIAEAVKNSEKPIVAWIREVGASGGYWVASAADKIVADPLSMTGSIGVIGSYLEFSGLMEEYGVGYEELKAGKYKDTGSPFKGLNVDEKILLQGKLDLIHEFFMKDVAENRNLDIEEVREIGTGMFYLGEEAKDLGLVDYLGGREKVDEIIMVMTGVKKVEIVSFQQKTSVLDLLGKVSNENSYLIGQGIGENLKIDTRSNFELIA